MIHEPAPAEAPGYLLLAAEVDRRPHFLPASAAKRRLMADVTARLHDLRSLPGVVRATTSDRVSSLAANYDLVVVIETKTPRAAASLRSVSSYVELRRRLGATARRTVELDDAAPSLRDAAIPSRQSAWLAALWPAACAWPRRLLIPAQAARVPTARGTAGRPRKLSVSPTLR
jgi:hypothetical protein